MGCGASAKPEGPREGEEDAWQIYLISGETIGFQFSGLRVIEIADSGQAKRKRIPKNSKIISINGRKVETDAEATVAIREAYRTEDKFPILLCFDKLTYNEDGDTKISKSTPRASKSHPNLNSATKLSAVKEDSDKEMKGKGSVEGRDMKQKTELTAEGDGVGSVQDTKKPRIGTCEEKAECGKEAGEGGQLESNVKQEKSHPVPKLLSKGPSERKGQNQSSMHISKAGTVVHKREEVKEFGLKRSKRPSGVQKTATFKGLRRSRKTRTDVSGKRTHAKRGVSPGFEHLSGTNSMTINEDSDPSDSSNNPLGSMRSVDDLCAEVRWPVGEDVDFKVGGGNSPKVWHVFPGGRADRAQIKKGMAVKMVNNTQVKTEDRVRQEIMSAKYSKSDCFVVFGAPSRRRNPLLVRQP